MSSCINHNDNCQGPVKGRTRHGQVWPRCDYHYDQLTLGLVALSEGECQEERRRVQEDLNRFYAGLDY